MPFTNAAAGEVGDSETQSACKENLREEEEMADWLESKLGTVTSEFLRRDARDSDTAKR
ncbi:DUF892 family protein [Mesorhizobium sp.]|uniref:DUF892 family protein n=1 Tax=Mesorhizobium sp. TaxID=1871066 RepID=UPI00121B399D|nr:DUF892 family protein [Mesorhizobium sp.]TIM06759.1 MAG: DUF892 family protein [Mesorhizobium sp.]